jgi:hypothetical protein
MKKQYLRLQNPFLLKGKRNFKNMATQSTCNYDALNANKDNPRVNDRRLLTEPVYINFRHHYDIWYNSQGAAKGGTKGFSDVFAEAPARLKHWQHKVIDVFAENTTEFLSIFPKGRNEIYKGTQEEQLLKMRSFGMEVKKYPELLSLVAEISDYNALLDSLYKSKGLQQDSRDKSSAELDDAYDAMGQMLFSNLLTLTDIFILNTDVVLDYFDISLLRAQRKQKIA